MDPPAGQTCQMNSTESATSTTVGDVVQSEAGMQAAPLLPSTSLSSGGGGGPSGKLPSSSSTTSSTSHPPLWVVPPQDLTSFIAFLPRIGEVLCRQFDAIVMAMLVKLLTTTTPKPTTHSSNGEGEGTTKRTGGVRSSSSAIDDLPSVCRAVLLEMARANPNGTVGHSMPLASGHSPTLPKHPTAATKLGNNGGGGGADDPPRRAFGSFSSSSFVSPDPHEGEDDEAFVASPLLREAVIRMGFVGVKRVVDALWTVLTGSTRAEVEAEGFALPTATPSVVSALHPSPFPPVPQSTSPAAVGESPYVIVGSSSSGGSRPPTSRSRRSSSAIAGTSHPTISPSSVLVSRHRAPSRVEVQRGGKAGPTVSDESGKGIGKECTDGGSGKGGGGRAATAAAPLPLNGSTSDITSSHSSSSSSSSSSSGSGTNTTESTGAGLPSLGCTTVSGAGSASGGAGGGNPLSWYAPSVWYNSLLLPSKDHMCPEMMDALQKENAKCMLCSEASSVDVGCKNMLLQSLLQQLFFLPPPPPAPVRTIDSAAPLPTHRPAGGMVHPTVSLQTSASSSTSLSPVEGSAAEEPSPLLPPSSSFASKGTALPPLNAPRASNPLPPPLRPSPAPPSQPPPAEAFIRHHAALRATSSPTATTSVEGLLPSIGTQARQNTTGAGDGPHGSPRTQKEKGGAEGSSAACHRLSLSPFSACSSASASPILSLEACAAWVPDVKVEHFLLPLFPELLPLVARMDQRKDDKGATLRLLSPEAILPSLCTVFVHYHLEDPTDVAVLYTFFLEALTEEWYRHIPVLSPGCLPIVLPVAATPSPLLPTASGGGGGGSRTVDGEVGGGAMGTTSLRSGSPSRHAAVPTHLSYGTAGLPTGLHPHHHPPSSTSSPSSSVSVTGGGGVRVGKEVAAAVAIAGLPTILHTWLDLHVRPLLLAAADMLRRTTTALPPPPPPPATIPPPLLSPSASSSSLQPTPIPRRRAVSLTSSTSSPSPHAFPTPLVASDIELEAHPTAVSTSSSGGGASLASPRERANTITTTLPLLSTTEVSPKASHALVSSSSSSAESPAVEGGGGGGAVGIVCSPTSSSSSSSSPFPVTTLSGYFPYLTASQQQVAKAHGFFREACPIQVADPSVMYDTAHTTCLFQDVWTKSSTFVLHSTDLVFLQPSNQTSGRGAGATSSPHHPPPFTIPPTYEWASSNKMWSIRTRLISLRGHYLYIYSGMASTAVLTEYAGEPPTTQTGNLTNTKSGPLSSAVPVLSAVSKFNSRSSRLPSATATSSPRGPSASPTRLSDVICYDSPIALIDLCRCTGSPVYMVSGPHDVESVTLRTPGKSSGWREMPLWSKGEEGGAGTSEGSASGNPVDSEEGNAAASASFPPAHPLATAMVVETEVLRTCNSKREVQLLTLPIPSSVLRAASLAQTPLMAPPFCPVATSKAAAPPPSTMAITASTSNPPLPLHTGLSALPALQHTASDSVPRRQSTSRRVSSQDVGLEIARTALNPTATTPKKSTFLQSLLPFHTTTNTTTTTTTLPSSSSLHCNAPPPPPPPVPSVTVSDSHTSSTMRWLNRHHYKNVSGGPIRQRMYPIRLLVKNELHHFLFQSPGERAKWYTFFEDLAWTFHNVGQVRRITRSFRSFSSFIRHRFPYPVGPAAFETVSMLGAGTYGHVLLVQHKLTRKKFAMKVVRKNNFLTLRSVIEARREHSILERLDCPYIMKLHDTFQTDTSVYFLLDFLSGGDLLKHIQNAPDRHLSESMSRFVIAEVAIALEHLRVRGIVHRDLKGDNLVMDAEGHVVLTDFGFAKQITVPKVEDYPKIISIGATGAGGGSSGVGGNTGVPVCVRLPSMVGGGGGGGGGNGSSVVVGHTGSLGTGSSLTSAPLLMHSKSGSMRYHLTGEDPMSNTTFSGGGGGGGIAGGNGSLSATMNWGTGLHSSMGGGGGGNLYTTYPYYQLYNHLPSLTNGFHATTSLRSTGNTVAGGGGTSSEPVVVIPQHNSCGTVAYIAPEVIRSSHQGDGYGLEVDWWSLGVVLFTLLTGLFPFFKDTPQETSHEIVHSAVRFPHDMRGGKNIPSLSKEAQHLVLCLLEKKPEKRLCCLKDMKQHAFFKGFDWDACEARRLSPPQELHVDIYSSPCSSREVVERLKRRVEWATSLQAHPPEFPPSSIPVEDPSPYQTGEAFTKQFHKLTKELEDIHGKYGDNPPPVKTVKNDIFHPLYARQERCGSDRDIFRLHHDIVLSTQKSYNQPAAASASFDAFGGGNGLLDTIPCVEAELAEDYIPKVSAPRNASYAVNSLGCSTSTTALLPTSPGTQGSDLPGLSMMSGSFSLMWGGGCRSVRSSAMSMSMCASATFPVPPIDLEMGSLLEEAETSRTNAGLGYGNASIWGGGEVPSFLTIEPIFDDYDDMAYRGQMMREVNYIRDGDTSLYRPIMHT